MREDSNTGNRMRSMQSSGIECGKAVQELGLNAEIEKVTGIQDILKFEILMMPGLVIDGKVRAAGRVPSADEIKQLLVADKEAQ